MRALILERDRRVRRHLVRYFMCAGYQVMAVDDPALLVANLDGVGLVAGDALDAPLLVRALSQRPDARGLLWTSEPLERALAQVLDTPRLSNICGRRDCDSPPDPRELLMVARRLAADEAPAVTFSDFLDWGYTGLQERIASTEERDRMVAKVMRFVTRLGTSERVGEMLGEVAHEMLMNAIFDAPVDGKGRPRYAHDRRMAVALDEHERPVFRIASDGSRVVLQVVDTFGRLRREHVFGGLQRALERGTLDVSYGGGGLGLAMCHRATVALYCDVVDGRKTEVTAIFDLSLNLRDFRARAKSLHFFAG